MRLKFFAAFAGTLLILPVASARAGMPYTQEMTCPIGGETFSFTTTASYSTWGGRPDGRPYGSWHFPLDLPECPSNRLILYKDFNEEELSRLAVLIARPDYQALSEETQYYRLHWLLREMGSPAFSHLWALVQAGWQTGDQSPRRRHYLEEFSAQMAAIEGDPESLEQFAMRGRWINALRELGRFDEAAALIARTSLEPLRRASEDEDEAEGRQGWMAYFAILSRLVGRRDDSAEPFDAIPERIAIDLCIERADGLGQWDRAFCELKAGEVARLRRSRGS